MVTARDGWNGTQALFFVQRSGENGWEGKTPWGTMGIGPICRLDEKGFTRILNPRKTLPSLPSQMLIQTYCGYCINYSDALRRRNCQG